MAAFAQKQKFIGLLYALTLINSVVLRWRDTPTNNFHCEILAMKICSNSAANTVKRLNRQFICYTSNSVSFKINVSMEASSLNYDSGNIISWIEVIHPC